MHQYKQKPNHSQLHSIPIYKLGDMLHGFCHSIPLVSIAALLFLGLVTIFPITHQYSHAETRSTPVTNSDASVELTVANTNLSKESSTTNVNYISTNLTLTATNIETYSIFLQAAEGFSNKLIGEQKGTEITGVGTKVAPSAFTNNTWGYNLTPGTMTDLQLASLSYNTVPANNEIPLTPAYVQQNYNEASTGKAFTLTFAAKFSDLTVPDHYKTSVLISVAANPEELTNALDQVSYMQDLTQDICKHTFSNSTKQLTDQRDNKSYWIAKLADGNCWMTQNLDYNGGGTHITALDGSGASGTIGGVESLPQWQDDKNRPEFYDPGNYYWTPNGWSECNTNKGFAGCDTQKWSTNGDSHYHIGNFYSWEATKNGNVCPTGWQLPTSTTADNGSFAALLSSGNIASTPTGVAIFTSSPYYFIPGGYIRTSGLNIAGKQGFYWASTAIDPDFAYGIDFTASNVNPNSNNSRYNGANVRCLVLGS